MTDPTTCRVCDLRPVQVDGCCANCNTAIARLRAAGLNMEAAETVARHPRGGPVVLGPGVIICLFPTRANTGTAVKAS
jgi:hypothetical protein